MAANTSAALYAVVSSAPAAAAPKDVADLKHHGKDGRFQNPWPSFSNFNMPTIMSKMIWRNVSGKAHSPDTTPPTVPVKKPVFLPSRETKHLRATWLGHACYYVEFPSGLRVLFDPVFTDRCSPFSFMGPKRYTDAPCKIADIPIIDAVVISHNHYDHLSHPTVQEIHKLHPRAHFFAPLGNKQWFDDCGISNSTDLDWWHSRTLTLSPQKEKSPDVDASTPPSTSPDSISAVIGCLPCQHQSARSATDRAKTLWASWSVESGGQKVWFAGDTGYRTVPDDEHSDAHLSLPHCPAFAEIGQHRGPFHLGLVPIGAYRPRSIMSAVHANPFDSVAIFKDTRCARALAMHWGTWVLTEEDVLEPPALLKTALAQAALPPTGVFDACDIGESREFPAESADGPAKL